MSVEPPVIIVGAGLAGLNCALHLKSRGVSVRLLEASDRVGGRVKTDNHQGFLLDHGFQIFLTAYPEAKAVLDYGKLRLKPFLPGAIVRTEGKFTTVADPLRCPGRIVESAVSPVGTLSDKLHVALLRESTRHSLRRKSLEAESSNGDHAESTLLRLQRFGFSNSIIESFFRPFFSGIFLESELSTSASVFDFVFDMLASGDNVLPASGMQAIPAQLAEKLGGEAIVLNCPVSAVDRNRVTLANGEELPARAVVLATDEPARRRLLGESEITRFHGQTCIYFAADKPPIDEPIIVLNADKSGPVNNFQVPSNVAEEYAPKGASLLSAAILDSSGLGQSDLIAGVKEQMKQWFGLQVNQWQWLKTYHIPYALPDQTSAALQHRRKGLPLPGGIYTCGDYLDTASINGALASGRRAAEVLISQMQPAGSGHSRV